MNHPQEKEALCMKAEDLIALLEEPRSEIKRYGDQETLHLFFRMASQLEPRRTCENDVKLRQLIPYVTLRNEKNEIFIYQRGKAGEDKRVTDKYSIGVGGHTEIAPARFRSLFTVLTQETMRELKEEVGYDSEDAYNKVINAMCNIYGFLHASDNSEEQTHLGISMIIKIKEEELGPLEDGHIVDGKWLSLNEILRLHHSGEIELELLSLYVAQSLATV